MPGKKKDNRVRVKEDQLEALLAHYTDTPDQVLQETKQWALKSSNLNLHWILKVFQKHVKVEAKDQTIWQPISFRVASEISSSLLMNLWCCYIVCRKEAYPIELDLLVCTKDALKCQKVVGMVREIAGIASRLNRQSSPREKYFDDRVSLLKKQQRATFISREQSGAALLAHHPVPWIDESSIEPIANALNSVLPNNSIACQQRLLGRMKQALCLHLNDQYRMSLKHRKPEAMERIIDVFDRVYPQVIKLSVLQKKDKFITVIRQSFLARKGFYDNITKDIYLLAFAEFFVKKTMGARWSELDFEVEPSDVARPCQPVTQSHELGRVLHSSNEEVECDFLSQPQTLGGGWDDLGEEDGGRLGAGWQDLPDVKSRVEDPSSRGLYSGSESPEFVFDPEITQQHELHGKLAPGSRSITVDETSGSLGVITTGAVTPKRYPLYVQPIGGVLSNGGKPSATTPSSVSGLWTSPFSLFGAWDAASTVDEASGPPLVHAMDNSYFS